MDGPEDPWGAPDVFCLTWPQRSLRGPDRGFTKPQNECGHIHHHHQDDLKNRLICTLFFKSSWCKIATSAVKNWSNSVPQEAVTTFCLLFCKNPSSMIEPCTHFRLSTRALAFAPLCHSCWAMGTGQWDSAHTVQRWNVTWRVTTFDIFGGLSNLCPDMSELHSRREEGLLKKKKIGHLSWCAKLF